MSKVLLVDDEMNVLKALRRVLQPLGHEVLLAQSPEEGLKLLDLACPDVIISDYKMPKMNGAEFLSLAQKKCPESLRVILTGHVDEEALLESMAVGHIFRFITKPWEQKEILSVIEEAERRKKK